MKLVSVVLGGIVLFWIAALILLYFTQRELLFHPTREHGGTEGFRFETPAGSIWIERRNPGRKRALIYFPGNSEHWWEDPDDLARIFPEYTLYFPHYPGYGKSEGNPSQESMFAMALRLYDTVAPIHHRIDLIGRSLGSGIALYLASRRQVNRLVLVTPYDSVASLGAERYPVFPVRFIIKDPFESLRYAPDVTAPTLVVLAENDRVIPREHSFRLIQALKNTEVTVYVLPNTDHTSVVDSPEYIKTLKSFLE